MYFQNCSSHRRLLKRTLDHSTDFVTLNQSHNDVDFVTLNQSNHDVALDHTDFVTLNQCNNDIAFHHTDDVAVLDPFVSIVSDPDLDTAPVDCIGNYLLPVWIMH